MRLSRYRHVIWDWNGTLLDDVDLCVDVMNGLLRRRRLPPLDRERYRRVFDFPVRDYYYRIGFDPAADPFDRLSVEFMSAYEARRLECGLHDGAAAALEAVRRAGLTQSILSAYRRESLREVVAHFGVASQFVRLVGLDHIRADSKAELGRAWIAELGLPPAEVVMVGDTAHDHEVAQAMGADCVLIAAGHHPAERLRRCGVPVFATLGEFAEAFGINSLP